MIEQFLRQIVEKVLDWLPNSLHNPAIYLVCAAVIFLAVLVAAILVFRILHIRWQTPLVHRLHLHNTGNVPGYFQLAAVAPAKDLIFEYYLDGARLAVKSGSLQPPVPSQPAGPHSTAAPLPQAAAAAPPRAVGPVQAASPAPQKGLQDYLSEVGKDAGSKSKEATGKGQALGGILGALGAILPGKAGEPFRQASGEVLGKVQKVRQVSDKPNQMVRAKDNLQSQAGHLAGSSGSAGSKPPAGRPPAGVVQPQVAAAYPISASAQPAAAGEKGSALPVESAASAQGEAGVEQYIELSAIKPEATTEVELRIRPLHPYRSGEVVYWLMAHQRLPAGFPYPPAQELAQKSVQRFYVRGISQFYRLTTLLLVLVSVELNLLWSLPIVRWLLQFRLGG
jgi:hypothetical protein